MLKEFLNEIFLQEEIKASVNNPYKLFTPKMLKPDNLRNERDMRVQYILGIGLVVLAGMLIIAR